MASALLFTVAMIGPFYRAGQILPPGSRTLGYRYAVKLNIMPDWMCLVVRKRSRPRPWGWFSLAALALALAAAIVVGVSEFGTTDRALWAAGLQVVIWIHAGGWVAR